MGDAVVGSGCMYFKYGAYILDVHGHGYGAAMYAAVTACSLEYGGRLIRV